MTIFRYVCVCVCFLGQFFALLQQKINPEWSVQRVVSKEKNVQKLPLFFYPKKYITNCCIPGDRQKKERSSKEFSLLAKFGSFLLFNWSPIHLTTTWQNWKKKKKPSELNIPLIIKNWKIEKLQCSCVQCFFFLAKFHYFLTKKEIGIFLGNFLLVVKISNF